MKPQGLTWPVLVGLATLWGVACEPEPTVVGELAAVEVSVARAGTILHVLVFADDVRSIEPPTAPSRYRYLRSAEGKANVRKKAENASNPAVPIR